MDHGTCPTRATIQAPSGERPQTTTTSTGEKDSGWAILSAPFGARSHGDAPETVRKDGHRRVLVVHEWRATVKTSSVHTVPIVDGAAAKVVEGRGGGVRVGAPAHPFGQTSCGTSERRGRFWSSCGPRESDVLEWGGSLRRTGGRIRTERRAGRGRPRLYFSFVLSLVRFYFFSGDESGVFLLSFLRFLYWWLGA